MVIKKADKVVDSGPPPAAILKRGYRGLIGRKAEKDTGKAEAKP